MNFLAHVYLAPTDDAFQAGNLMGDFVRGRVERLALPPELADGIRLHRHIDSFSDAHPLVRRSRRRFHGTRRRVAGIVVDMAYDHFLARHWARFDDRPLTAFTRGVYERLAAQAGHLPPRLERLLPVMRDGDWLASYGTLDALDHALDRMAGRLSRPEALRGAITDVRAAYEGLEADCLAFLPEARAEATAWCRHHGRLAPATTPG